MKLKSYVSIKNCFDAINIRMIYYMYKLYPVVKCISFIKIAYFILSMMELQCFYLIAFCHHGEMNYIMIIL